MLDVLERAKSGEKVTEKEFDFMYFRKTEEIRKKHPEIQSPKDPNIFINLDDDMADSVFEAGIELLLETGGYCITTDRIIKWTEEEIRTCLKNIKNEVVFGEGRDQRTFIKRNIEDSRPPGICPGFHAPYNEDIIPELIKVVAMIPEAYIIEGCNFPTIEGHQIWGLPLEVYGIMRQVGWLKEGVRKAGRPGMGILAYPISPKAATITSILNPEYGIGHNDGISLNPLNGQKLEYEYLTASVVAQEYGCNIVGGGLPAGIGGYSGEPEGGAIGAVSAQINGLLAYRPNFGSTDVWNIWMNKDREREVVWARSAAIQALILNTALPLLQYITHYAGPCTDMCLQEVAAKTIALVGDGANIALHTCTTSVPRWNNVQTPTEALWMIDVANAAVSSRLKRDEANKIVGQLHMKYKDRLSNPPKGRSILECFDLRSRTPSDEFLEIRGRVEKELSNLGLKV